MIRNKKAVMCFSALMIVIYHLWVTIFSGNMTEMFLVKTAYIGVDIFFLLSAFSLSSRRITDIKAYYMSRFTSVYLKFFLFAIVAAIVSKYTILQLVKIVTGVELFQKGGGSFLWFLPAITIFYLVYPWIQRIGRKLFGERAYITAGIVLVLWFVIGFTVTKFTGYKAMFIFFSRIPVIVIGCLMGVYSERLKAFFAGKKGTILRAALGVILCAIGYFLLWKFGFRSKLSQPIYDMYYVVAIPAALGLTMLVDFIPEVIVIKQIGSATLEMYAIQMIFGFKLANAILKKVKSPMITDLCVIVIITAVSVALSMLYGFVYRKIKALRRSQKQK